MHDVGDERFGALIASLDTAEYRKAYGELLAGLIRANLKSAQMLAELSVAIQEGARESARLSRRVLWLTLLIAVATCIQGSYYGVELAKQAARLFTP